MCSVKAGKHFGKCSCACRHYDIRSEKYKHFRRSYKKQQSFVFRTYYGPVDTGIPGAFYNAHKHHIKHSQQCDSNKKSHYSRSSESAEELVKLLPGHVSCA